VVCQHPLDVVGSRDLCHPSATALEAVAVCEDPPRLLGPDHQSSQLPVLAVTAARSVGTQFLVRATLRGASLN